jgi:hypothetical protein
MFSALEETNKNVRGALHGLLESHQELGSGELARDA